MGRHTKVLPSTCTTGLLWIQKRPGPLARAAACVPHQLVRLVDAVKLQVLDAGDLFRVASSGLLQGSFACFTAQLICKLTPKDLPKWWADAEQPENITQRQSVAKRDGLEEELDGATGHVGIEWRVGALAMDVAPNELWPGVEDQIVHEEVQ